MWRGNLTQEDALCYYLNYCDVNERYLMECVESKLVDNPEQAVILPMNPCHFGLVFAGFRIGKYVHIWVQPGKLWSSKVANLLVFFVYYVYVVLLTGPLILYA